MGAEQGAGTRDLALLPPPVPGSLDLCGEEGPPSHCLPLCVCVTEMLKDKNKPVMPARARGPRARRRRPGEAEETAEPEQPAATLETCRGFLRSILTHWGPALPGPERAQEPTTRASPESRAPGLACAAASLAVSWVLRSVAGHPPSRAEAAGLLGWLQRHILPQPVVVTELLRDSAVRGGLFQLCSRFCGAQELVGPAHSVACLFGAVLLQLLAAQGPAPSPCHLAVQSLCLSALQEDDEATRGEAGSQRPSGAWAAVFAWASRSAGGRSLPSGPERGLCPVTTVCTAEKGARSEPVQGGGFPTFPPRLTWRVLSHSASGCARGRRRAYVCTCMYTHRHAHVHTVYVLSIEQVLREGLNAGKNE